MLMAILATENQPSSERNGTQILALELKTELIAPTSHYSPSHSPQTNFECRLPLDPCSSRLRRQRLHSRYPKANTIVHPSTTPSASRQARYVNKSPSISLMFMPKMLVTSVRGRYTAATSVSKVARSACRLDASESWTVTAPITRWISSLSSLWSERRSALAF